jgi:hypothetical protein
MMNIGTPMTAPMMDEIRIQPTNMSTAPIRRASKMPVKLAIIVTNRQASTTGQSSSGTRRFVWVFGYVMLVVQPLFPVIVPGGHDAFHPADAAVQRFVGPFQPV